MTPEIAIPEIAAWLAEDGEEAVQERAAILAAVMDERGFSCALDAISYLEDYIEQEGEKVAEDLVAVLEHAEPGEAEHALDEYEQDPAIYMRRMTG